MAVQVYPRIVRKGTPGAGAWVDYFLEATGQTFKKGEFVYLAAATNGVTVRGTEGVIFGIARTDATGTAGSRIEVEVLELNDEMEIQYTGSGTPYVGTAYGLDVASHVNKLDVADPTNDMLVITAILDTTNKIVRVRLIPTDYQTAYGI